MRPTHHGLQFEPPCILSLHRGLPAPAARQCVKPLILPAWSPNVNAFAERFVESAKSECLERMVLLGERHVRAAVRAFLQHYHEERPHQGPGNKRIAPKTTVIGTGPIECGELLGGLLRFYYREAA